MDKSKFVPLNRDGIEMKKGSEVMIYQDPISQLKPEGYAKLMNFVSDDPSDDLERWNVIFGDGFECARFIKIYDPAVIAALKRAELSNRFPVYRLKYYSEKKYLRTRYFSKISKVEDWLKSKSEKDLPIRIDLFSVSIEEILDASWSAYPIQDTYNFEKDEKIREEFFRKMRIVDLTGRIK